MKQERVVEKHYTPGELHTLLGFAPKFWRERAQAGDLTLAVDGVVIAEPVEIAGELRIPASAVNAFIARRPYRPGAGVKARSLGELRRRVARAGVPADGALEAAA